MDHANEPKRTWRTHSAPAPERTRGGSVASWRVRAPFGGRFRCGGGGSRRRRRHVGGEPWRSNRYRADRHAPPSSAPSRPARSVSTSTARLTQLLLAAPRLFAETWTVTLASGKATSSAVRDHTHDRPGTYEWVVSYRRRNERHRRPDRLRRRPGDDRASDYADPFPQPDRRQRWNLGRHPDANPEADPQTHTQADPKADAQAGEHAVRQRIRLVGWQRVNGIRRHKGAGAV